MHRLLLAAALAPLAVATPAGATLPNPSWTCDAHVATLNFGGASGATLDPLHANSGAGLPCRDDGATLPLVAAKDVLGADSLSLTSSNAQAQTGLTNALGPTYRQAPAAAAELSDTTAEVGGASGLTVTAKLVRSYVYGQCRGTTPFLGTPAGPAGGEVVDLRINGTAIPAEGEPDQTATQVVEGLSPLAPIVRVTLNKTYAGTDADGEHYFRREAVRVEALTAPDAEPFATIVLAAARVDRFGEVCAVPPGVTPSGSGDTPAVAPPALLSGGNEPGSNGGGSGSSGSGSGSATSGSSTKGSSGRPDNGTNASRCVRLRMSFDTRRGPHAITGSGPHRIRSRRGTRPVVRGVIRNCKGQPIVHAKIDQIHLIGPGKRLVKTGLRSRPGGRLTLILPNNLTSRRIVFRYRPFVGGTAVSGRQILRIKVYGPAHYPR